MVLEFSRVPEPSLRWLYDRYSFNVIPALGQALAGDRDSYRYLVESIRRFPDQEAFAAMIAAAGFGQVRYRNLSMASPRCTRPGSSDARPAQPLAADPHRRDLRAHRSDEGGAGRVGRAADAAAARVLGWPFQWLGLEGDPTSRRSSGR